MNDKQVLFVEDEGPLLEMIRDALEDEGYEVTLARNGAEGVVLLDKDKRYDWIISDVMMPEGVSGIELARKAAELQPQARVILVSGLARAQLPPLPEGTTFLPKPYRLRQLLQVLGKGIEGN